VATQREQSKWKDNDTGMEIEGMCIRERSKGKPNLYNNTEWIPHESLQAGPSPGKPKLAFSL
jgi:hypothetical protein